MKFKFFCSMAPMAAAEETNGSAMRIIRKECSIESNVSLETVTFIFLVRKSMMFQIQISQEVGGAW